MIALEPVIAARLLLRAAENVGHDFHGNQWTSYYHGTSEDSVSTILSEGLRPQKGAHKVFMTSDISEAKGFANNHKLGALLEIRVPKSVSVEKLAYNQAAHTAIPREWIRVHSTVKDNPASTGPSRVWRGAGDVEGHDFHGNQWSSRPLTLPEKRTIGNWQLTDRIDAKTRREMRELLKDASTTGSLARFRPETGITVWRGQDQVELQTGPRSFSTSEKDAKGWGKYVHPLVITDDTLALDLDRIKGKGQSEREVIVDVKKIKTLEEVGHDFHGNQYTVGYHGTTSSYVDSILSQGLNSDTQGHTYFTKSLGDAKAYANDTASRRGGTPVVLKIEIPRSESSRVVESYPMHLFKGRVPAEWVKVHSTTSEREFKLKVMATSRETTLHTTADSFIPKLQVAVRYAFAQGRKALLAAPNDHDKAARIVHDSLLEVLPTTLLKVLVAGGNAGLGLLDGRLLKVAGEDTGHDFHGNQWTSEGGSAGIVFHGTTRARLESILKNGIEPNASATRAEIAEPGKVAFATLNFKEAKAYAVDHNEVPNGVVLEIHVPKGERFSKSYGSSILHRDTAIPASWIKAVHARVDRTGKVYTGGGTGRYSRMGLTWQKIRSLAGDVAEVVYVVVSLGEDDLRAAASIKISFNASDPKAARWARDHAAELAKNLSDTTRQNIKDAVEESVSGDGSRQNILAAVGDSARAELIARTETMIAVHEGQRQGWDQAIDKGLLTGDEQVEWIATSGACPICDELDGELRDLDGEYPDPGGEGPPQHPNCRCTEGITA